MNKIVHLLVVSLIAILISTPLVAGGHKYIAPPVIFVHGFNSSMAAWDTTKSKLQNLYIDKYGYTYAAANPYYFPDINYGDPKRGDAFSGHGDCREIATHLDEHNPGLASVIYNAIGNAFYQPDHAYEFGKELVPAEEMKVILVCHSFGGIVTRSLLKQNENAPTNVLNSLGVQKEAQPGFFKSHIARVIFIDTPHAGSPLASALYMLRETEGEITDLHQAYKTHSIDIGFANNAGQKEYYYKQISDYLSDFINARNMVLGLAEWSAGVDTSCDRPYDTSLKQLRLNQDVTLKLYIPDLYGVHRTLYEHTTPGYFNFLGYDGATLGIPNKYCVIYSDLDRDWTNFSGGPISGGFLDLFCGLGGVLYNSMLKDYFIFPQGETLLDLVQNGDAIVCQDSALAIGGDKHLITDRTHVAETSYWEKIKEVLCEEAPIMNIQEPLPGMVYTTMLPTKGKLRDYLPLNSGVSVDVLDKANNQVTYSCNIVYDPNSTKKDLDLNPNYSEIGDNYQAIFNKVIPLFSYSNPIYGNEFKVTFTPYNAANIEGAEQGVDFTYACLVSTHTPANNESSVPLDKEIQITFNEKIRRETFQPGNISFTSNNTSILHNTTWIDEKTVKLSPYGPLTPNQQYTITLKGDNLNTYDLDYPTSTIEGIQYYLSDPAISEDNADKHGFDPDYSFTFTTGSNLGGGGGGIGSGGAPGNDHPDDNYGVETGVQVVEPLSSEAKVGLLGNGFGYDTYVQLTSLGINTRLIRLTDLDKAFSYPVLVIPTAGLYGLDNSATFKQKLADYVNQGGTIICFTQQLGYEFNALPGSPSGYGWSEDQSCWTDAAYINEISAVFNGQTNVSLDANLDGYFNHYPDNTKILLRRSKNNKPALIEYNYGKGRIIASTLYSDWGYGHGQVSENEKTLIKQLIEYALNPAISATQSLCFGGTPGVYQLWATSPVDTVSPGTILPITVHMKNNSDQEINSAIAVCADTPGGTWSYQYFYVYGMIPDIAVPAHSERAFVYNATMDLSTNFYLVLMDMDKINAAGSDAIQKLNIKYSFGDFVWSYFLAYGELGAWVSDPQITASIKLDKDLYYKNEKGTISLNLTDKKGIAAAVQVSLYLIDPDNIKIPILDLSLNLPANSSTDQVVEFNAPDVLKQGVYIVKADIGSGSTIISKAAASFYIPDSLMVVTPTLPTVITKDNTISFKIANRGAYDAPASKFNLKLSDSTGTVIFNKESDVPALLSGGETTIVNQIGISELKFGDYNLEYTLHYGAKSLVGSSSFKNAAIIEATYDKQVYRVREDVNLNVKITNNGVFKQQDLAVIIEVPDCDYSDTKEAMTLAPGENISLPIKYYLPESLPAGNHEVIITVKQGDDLQQKAFPFAIAPAKESFSLGKTSFYLDEYPQLKVSNTGGVDDQVAYVVSIANSAGSTVYYELIEDKIQANEDKLYRIGPLGVTETGQYTIRVYSMSYNGLQYAENIELKNSSIILSKELPQGYLISQPNAVQYSIQNDSELNIGPGTAILALEDNNGYVVWSDTKTITDIASQATVLFDYSIDLQNQDLAASKYLLKFKLDTLNLYREDKEILTNNYSIGYWSTYYQYDSHLGYVWYKAAFNAGDIVKYKVSLLNNGCFERTTKVDSVLNGVTLGQKEETLLPGQTKEIEMECQLPIDLIAGDEYQLRTFVNNTNQYDNYNKYLIVIAPPCVEITTEANSYLANKKVKAYLKNTGGAQTDVNYVVKLLDINSNQIHSSTGTVNILAQEEKNIELFTIPADLADGNYNLQIFYNEVANNSYDKYFTKTIAVTNLLAKMDIAYPVSYSQDCPIAVKVMNTGVLDISSGTVKEVITGPSNELVYEETKAFGALAVGSQIEHNFTFKLNEIKLGTYKLKYILQYEGRQEELTKEIKAGYIFEDVSTDKLQYALKDPIKVAVLVKNTGAIDLPLNITYDIKGTLQTQAIVLPVGQELTHNYDMSIPPTMENGENQLSVKCGLSLLDAGMTKTKTLELLSSKLVVKLSKYLYQPNDTINLKIQNTGGVDASCQYELILKDSIGIVIDQQSGSGQVEYGQELPVNITLPGQLKKGTYSLNVKYIDSNNNITQTWLRSISVAGITASLALDTDKDIYKKIENITSLGSLTSNLALTNAVLNIKVYRASEAWTNYINTSSIRDLLVDGDFVWFLSDNGLKRYDKINNSWKAWGGQDGIISSYFNLNGKMLFQDNASIYFLGFDLYWNNMKLYKVNKTTGHVNSFNVPAPYGSYYSSVKIPGIINNKLWIELGPFNSYQKYYWQFDISNTTFIKIDASSLPQVSKYYSLSGGVCFETAAIDNNTIWFVTGTEMHKLNEDTNTLEIMADNLPFENQYGFNMQSDGNYLWLVENWWGQGQCIYRFDKNTKALTTFPAEAYTDIKVEETEVWFIGNYKVTKFDKSNSNFTSYDFGAEVTDLCFDSDNVWVSGLAGVKKYYRPADSWTTYTSADGLVNNSVTSIGIDGNYVWLGTLGGISKYDQTANWDNFTEETYLNGATNAYPDGDNVWFTTSQGVMKYAKSEDQFTQLNNKYIQKLSIGTNALWYVENNAIYDLDKNTGIPTQVNMQIDGTVYDVIEDSGALWLVTWNNGTYMVRYDLGSQTQQEYLITSAGLVGISLISSLEDIIVIADQKIFKFNKTSNQILELDMPDLVWPIGYSDDGQYLWVRNFWTNQIVKFDKAGMTELKRVDIPGINGHDYTAINALNSNIWVYANIGDITNYVKGVAKYNENSGQWKTYTSADGLINGMVHTIANDESYVWFIGLQGVSRFKEKGTILWQKDLAINATTNYNINELIGQLGETGKFYIEGTATNSLGQQLAKAENNFYVTTSNVAMTMNADKKLYKTGETVNITGEVINSGLLDENSIQMSLGKESSNIAAGSYSLAPGAKQSYTASAIADKSFLLTGKTTCGTDTNTVEEYISVVDPQVEMTVTGPDTVGQDSFDIGILVKNSGQVNTVSSLQLADGSQNNTFENITLQPKETKYINQTYQITQDTSFEIKLAGDVAKTITKQVKFGCAAVMNITPAVVYPASTADRKEIFEIPVNISNTGTIDMLLNSKFQITNVKFNFEKNKEYYIPASGGVFDNLVLEGAPAGDYVLNYISDLISGSVLVRVAEFNTVEVTDIQYQVSGSTITAQAKVKNTGANEFVGNFAGNLKLGEAKSFETEQELILAINEEKTITFEVPTTNLAAGNYMIGAVALHNGFEIASRNTDISLMADYSIVAFDDNQVFNAGSQSEIKVKVKNIGPVEGQATVKLAAGDIVNSTKTAWLKSSEEKELTFTFVPVDDLEERQYTGYISVDDVEQQVKFYVNGYKIGVTSSFDKLAYTEGETAHLTLTLTNDGSLDATIFAKVNFNSYQTTTDKVIITKDNPVTLTFDVPVHHTGAKLFYGVYHESGRSLNLNTLYVYKQEGSVSFIADKQQYQAGENMSLTLLLTETGVLTLDAPGYQDDVNIVSVDTQTITFALPVDMVTGTHYVNYTFTPSSGTVQQGKLPIDVIGYTIKVLETTLDQGTYYPSDTIKFKTRIDSNKDIPDTQLKIWLKNSATAVECYSGNVTIETGQTNLTAEVPMTLANKGMGQLIFGVYKGDLLLTAGQKAFDVDIHDTEAPATIIQLTGNSVQVTERTYITDNTQMYFIAIDTGTSPTGIDFTEYAVDASTWTVYASSFTLSGEGEHTVKYRSRDKAGNLEDTKQAMYYLDSTLPVSAIKTPDTSYQTPEGSIYFVSPASFTITATDTLSGVDYVEYIVDNSTPVNTGYQNPIEIISDFADGSHSIKYFSVDKLGNKEADKTLTFLIDGNSPISQLKVTGSQFAVSGKTYIGQDAKIELTATDAGAGLDKISYRVDTGTTTIYAEPFGLTQEGMHTIYYSAADKLGNMETEKNYILYLDTTTPETSFKIMDASYEVTEGTTTYVNSSIPFLVSALDPVSNGVSSGLKHIKTKLDANEYTTILSSSCYISANSPDGMHTIAYYAMDNVANTEIVKTYAAIFDGTKPQVKSTYPANNAKVKAKQAVPITITFTEPVKSDDWSKDIILQEAKGKKIQDYIITYDSATCTLSIDGKLKNNTEYEVVLKNTISDRVRNYLDACWFSFRTMMEAAEGGTFSDTATGLTVIVPSNCLPCDGYFEIALLDQINPPKLPKPLKWLFDGQKAYQVIFYDVDGNIVQQPVKKAFQVVLALNQQWIALAMESDPIEYKNIKVYQTGSVSDFIASMAHQSVSASTEKSWFAPRLLTEQSYNAQAQELIVEMDSFGMFALAGFNAPGISLDDLSCYPNPFNPCKQDITIQYYLLNDSDVAIAIYDLLGNLVKTWEIPAGDMNARTGLNQLMWNGRNGFGDIVANGGYILFVHSDNQKKKFKILVVK